MIVIYWLGTGIEIFKFKFSFSFAWIVPHFCVSLPSWHWSRQLSSGIVPVSFLSVPDFPQPKHVTQHILKSSANKYNNLRYYSLNLLRCCSVNQHSSYKYSFLMWHQSIYMYWDWWHFPSYIPGNWYLIDHKYDLIATLYWVDPQILIECSLN